MMKKTRPAFRPEFIFIAVLGIVLFLALISLLGNMASRLLAVESTIPNPTLATVQNLVIASNTGSATSLPTPTEMPPATPTIAQWMHLSPISQENIRGLITNGSRDQYRVALTFDVCQRDDDLAGYDTEIVRVLNETQTPATFFLGGLWMRDHKAETLELAGNPLFELGNHSWSHEDFSVIPRDEMEQEVLQTQQMMYDLLGYQTNLFRLPYGTYTDEALNLINDQGMYIIQWDDVSGDPDPNIDAKSMTSWVLQQVQPGSIIIMHANGRGWHTAEALPDIIQALRQEGYTPVTVSELLNIPPYK